MDSFYIVIVRNQMTKLNESLRRCVLHWFIASNWLLDVKINSLYQLVKKYIDKMN